MSRDSQALYLNAIPLLAMASLYLATGVALAPEIWRQRRRARDLEIVLALFFPCVGVAAALVGVIVLRNRDAIGNPWLTLIAIALAAVPPFVFLLRWPDRALLLSGSRRALEAERRTGAAEERREALKSFADALGATRDASGVGRLLAQRATAMLGTEFAAVWLVEGDAARGLVALLRGQEQSWFEEASLDLRSEPSAVASVAFDASPLVIYDASGSALINPRIAAIVKPKSGIFAPLVSGDRVIAVLAVVAVASRRRFDGDALRLIEELCSEAALALERARSSAALERALERERLVAEIARQVRSELDLRSVMTVAAADTWRALGASRGIVRLTTGGRLDTVAADWHSGRGEGTGDVPLSPVAELAARERRTVAIEDVAASEVAPSAPALLAAGARAVLATPVVVSGVVFGVLEAHRSTTGAWSAEDVELAEAVAREIALVAQTTRLLEENEARLRQQTALLHAAQVVTSELEPAIVLNRLVDEVAQLIDADAADFYVLDAERKMLRCAAVRGLPEDVVGWEFPSDRGLAGEALARGRGALASDYARAASPVSHEAYEGFRYAMVAPVTWGGEPRGVLGVGSRAAEDPFGTRDLELLEAFAGLAALALRNAQAFEERTRQARIQRGFFAIASALAEPLSTPATLGAVAQAATEALGGACAAVVMPGTDGLEVAGAHELPESLRAAFGGRDEADATLLDAARAARILASPALAEDSRFAERWRRVATEAGFVSLVAIPIGLREQERGAVVVFLAERRRLADDDIALARQLAGAAHGALERASLYEEERRSRALAQQLARTGSLLATELDPAAVVDEVVRRAPSLLGVEACVVRVVEGGDLVVSAVEGEGTEALLGSRAPSSGRLSGEVVGSQLPVAVADAARDGSLRADDPLLDLGYRAYLGVPLAGREGVLHGVLAVYARRPKEWRDEEVQALQALAGNAAAAVSNAELYQRVALANERSHAILSNIADGIVAVNRDGAVVLWNRAAEEVTGVPAAEALNRAPAEVLGRGLDVDGGPGDRLVRIVRGDEDVWLSVTEAVMRDPAGAVAGRIYAFRDISSDRLVEEMKSDFVAAVSQELRRPLTSIYGFAETLLRRDVLFSDEERRTFLDYIASEAERLTAIVDALLNVARLDTGDMQVALAPTEVGELLQEAVAVLEPGAARNGHRFVVDVPSEPVAVEADREKLRIVLSHLLDNAVRYSPDGGTVTVAARRRGEAVEISIADEGIGIPSGEQERIFRKFYRADPGGTRTGGTGLGLFIARGLVTAMGGRIWVSSSEGTGSRFAVELRLAETAALAGATQE